MAKAAGRFLHGRDFPVLGLPRFLERAAPLLDLLSPTVRGRLYTASACFAAFPSHDLDRVRADDVAAWMAGQFPRDRRYPAVLLGSPNGAAVHLAAALGIPYLPQTFLVSVSHEGAHVDDVQHRMATAAPGARKLLEANPGLQIHQLHDPVNDRPMLECMDYFRVKFLRIEPAYERFIRDTLEPGGTLLVVEDQATWPTTLVQERHLFQLGGLGSVRMDEYFEGGPRVERFLEKHGSPWRSWHPPEPDGNRPESEWGLEPSWHEEVRSLSERQGYRVARLTFQETGQLSPVVADLYRWWYRRRGLGDGRLVAECFFLLDPWWSLATGSVPYWMVFNTSESVEDLERYVEARDPFDHIGMMLLSNAVEAIGDVDVAQARRVLARARVEGRFLGFDPRKHPQDMASMARYRPALEAWTDERPPMPEPLSLGEVEAFFTEQEESGVLWTAEPPERQPAAPGS